MDEFFGENAGKKVVKLFELLILLNLRPCKLSFVNFAASMKNKKYFSLGLVVVLIVLGYFLTSVAFPKNLNRYPFLVMLFLFEVYVWGMFKKKVFTYSRTIKILTAAVYWFPTALLLASVVVMMFIEGRYWNPLVRNLVFGMVFSFFVAKLFMAIVLGLSDFIRLIEFIISRFKRKDKDTPQPQKKGISRKKFLENFALVTGGVVLGTMFMGMFKWVHDFSFKRIQVQLPGLSTAFDDYCIVQISDLHLGSWSTTEHVELAMAQINALEPDLVVFTGDLVNYTTDEAYRFKDILASLTATDGVIATLGNHDYGDYINWPDPAEKKKNMEDLYGFFHQIGWKLLRNEHHIIERDQEKLAIIGVENWSQNTRFPRYGNIIKARKGIGKVSASILLSHDPSHWDAVILKDHPDIQLTLSGHTHGFQFGIEIPGIKWSPAQYIYKQWAGLYTNEATKQQLYVNRGMGSIGYPGRIGILPEITIFNLKS